jgi:hypothetical protein
MLNEVTSDLKVKQNSRLNLACNLMWILEQLTQSIWLTYKEETRIKHKWEENLKVDIKKLSSEIEPIEWCS